jgi:hypothetical protein
MAVNALCPYIYVVPKKYIGSLRSMCSYFVYDDGDEVAISSEI